jgi:hypothetical protein
MTYPRSQIAPPDQPGYFHVVTRCVRRAFLCGPDRFSGRNFDHRRQWIENRIRLLADSFAVSVFSYAVAQARAQRRFAGRQEALQWSRQRVSNHAHIVLHVDPNQIASWTDDEAARRWLRAFPGALRGAETAEQEERAVLSLISTPKRLNKIRERLGNLSWFMRALNEPIARMANKEDGCSGRFWEGRFKCQALLEEQAVLSAMAYVDLNPVRAAMAEASYIELVQWTGEQARSDKRGKLQSDNPPAALWAVAKHPRQHRRRRRGGLRACAQEATAECRRAWVRQVQGTESAYYRAIGSAEALMLKAKELKQHWMKGVCGERARQLWEPLNNSARARRVFAGVSGSAWASAVWSFQMSEPKRGEGPAKARPEGFCRRGRISIVAPLGRSYGYCRSCRIERSAASPTKTRSVQSYSEAPQLSNRNSLHQLLTRSRLAGCLACL